MRANTPPGFSPPYEAYEAKFDDPAKPLVTAYVGVQDRGGDALGAWTQLQAVLRDGDGPDVIEQGYSDDVPGARSRIALLSWRDEARFASWRAGPAFSAWLDSHEDPLVGRWVEASCVRPGALDTLIARPGAVWGVGKLADAVAVTPYHAYWGGTRDRILLSAESALENPEGEALPAPRTVRGIGQRINVALPENAVFSRGGPDWSDCQPDERAAFRNSVYPAYVAGSRYLRDASAEAGCYAAYTIQETDADGRDLMRNHQIGYFVQLADLERWTRDHPTHKAIYGRFMAMLKQIGRMPDMNLYHEVSVVPAGGITASYVNCLPETGLARFGATEEL